MSSNTRTKFAVSAAQLRRVCDPNSVNGVQDKSDVIGQAQAMASIELGLKMSAGDYAKSHYNIVVVGSQNTGRTAKTLQKLRQYAAAIEAAPSDVLCLYNFAAPRRPVLVTVPGGQGQELKKRLSLLGKYVTLILPRMIAEFRALRLQMLQVEVEKLWREAGEKVKAYGFLLAEDDKTRFLVPMSMSKQDEPMPEEEYEALDEDIKAKLGEMHEQAQVILRETGAKAKKVIAKATVENTKVEQKLANEAVAKKVAPLRELVGKNEVFGRYLTEVEKAAVKCGLKEEESGGANPLLMLGQRNGEGDEKQMFLRQTEINLLVDNKGVKQPPVVHVKVPQYSELFGRINHQPVGPDTVRVDHTMIESGAVLKANGGYLILDLGDLLSWGGAISFYKLLKVIRTRKMAIEGKAKFVDVETLVDFHSEEFPVDVRVVAVCDRHMERMLRHYVAEFDNLFRIVAEFDNEMGVDEAPKAYASFVEICRADGQLPEFTPEAVAKLVEYGSRRVGDQGKASTEFGILKDVITEAAHWAKQAGAETVDAGHVKTAIEERFNRRALAMRRFHEHVDAGKIMLSHEDEKVGQINGLAVYALSEEVRFGLPTRITARAFAGPEKVVLVQREAELSGPSSNTAVAVIRGYLSGQYGRKKALSLAVQLCFEQCYGGIDGDSASLAETIAIISAITDLPVDQRLAVTGSMNQWGEAQPIGGANEKIEGHFGVLKRRGLLKAGHGVVLPKKNLEDLMLDEEVVEAQRQGLYQVYAVSSLDEALEIFLGRPAKEIHKLVEKKLAGKDGEKLLKRLLNKVLRRKAGKKDDK